MICEECLRLGTNFTLRRDLIEIEKAERRQAIQKAIELNPLLRIVNYVNSLKLVFKP